MLLTVKCLTIFIAIFGTTAMAGSLIILDALNKAGGL